MQSPRRHLWQITAAGELVILIVAALALWLMYVLRGIFFQVLIAAILAHLFNRLVTLLESK